MLSKSDYKQQIIEMLELADLRKMKCIYAFVSALLGMKEGVNHD